MKNALEEIFETERKSNMLNYKRYQKNPVIDYKERQWPNKEIEKARSK